MAKRMAALLLALVFLAAGCNTPAPASESASSSGMENSSGSSGDTPGSSGAAASQRWFDYTLPPEIKKANLEGLPEERSRMRLYFFGEEVIVILLPRSEEAGTGVQVWFYSIPEDKLFAHFELKGDYTAYTAKMEEAYLSLICHDYIEMEKPVRQSEEYRIYPDGSYKTFPSLPLDRLYNPSGTAYVKLGTWGIGLGEAGSDETTLVVPKGILPKNFMGYLPPNVTEEEKYNYYFPYRLTFWANDRYFTYYEVGWEWLVGGYIYDTKLGGILDLPELARYSPWDMTIDGRYAVFIQDARGEDPKKPEYLFIDLETSGLPVLPETPELLGLLPRESARAVEAEMEYLFVSAGKEEPRPLPYFLRFYGAGGVLIKEYPHMPASRLYRVSDRLLVLGPEDGYSYDYFDVNLDSILFVEVPKIP